MIVMKFGGTSVESAAAIERVAGIVKARAERRPVVVVSAMGKTTNKLLAIAAAAIEGKRDEYIRQIHDLRDLPFARSPPGGAAGRPRRARPHARRAFPGTHRTGQGPGRAGRTDARARSTPSPATASASPATSSPSPSATSACRPRTSIRATSSSPTSATPRPRRFSRDLRAPGGHHSAARRHRPSW